MRSHLIEIEQKAFQLRNVGQLKEAAELFAAIVNEQPDWEHGSGFYNLATCYEDFGEIALAEQCYRNALRCEPRNFYFLGGFASFLYLHGEASQAFDAHLHLLSVEFAENNHQASAKTIRVLNELGHRLGLSQQNIDARIEQAKITK